MQTKRSSSLSSFCVDDTPMSSSTERRLLSAVVCFHLNGAESTGDFDRYVQHVDVTAVVQAAFMGRVSGQSGDELTTAPAISTISDQDKMLAFCRSVQTADASQTSVIITDRAGATFLAKRFPRIGYRVSDQRRGQLHSDDLNGGNPAIMSGQAREAKVDQHSAGAISAFPNTLFAARHLLRQRPLQILIVPAEGDQIENNGTRSDDSSLELDASFIHHVSPGKRGLSNALFRLLIDAAAMQERMRLLNVLMQNEEIICNFNEELSRQTAALSYANARLSEMAMTDPLTGKYNRRYFKRRYGLEVERSHRAGLPLSVLMIDIDYFKRYNDVNGHVAGDVVLKQVADLIGQERRLNDVIARYGGEEFVVLLPDTPKWAAIQLAERMRNRVFSASFADGDTQRSHIVSVSIGVATCPDDTIVADELIQTADTGLYEAKRLGRNRVEPGKSINVGRSHDSHVTTNSAPPQAESVKTGASSPSHSWTLNADHGFRIEAE